MPLQKNLNYFNKIKSIIFKEYRSNQKEIKGFLVLIIGVQGICYKKRRGDTI